MRFSGSQLLRRAIVGVACLSLVATGITVLAAPSFAASPHGGRPVVGSDRETDGRGYLALGDSVSFGYRESNTVPPPNYTDASSFVGYPEDVAAALDLHLANAACPGETTSSLILPNVQSNGCENSPGGGPGYRVFPLHVRYSGTQLDYAVDYLKTHRGTRLVSLMIGANDAFLCQETTADHCATELPAVLAKIAVNVGLILNAIRNQAHYRGQVVILNYYSLDYNDAVATGGSMALNAAMDLGAKPFNVTIADGFAAFQVAALHSGANSCTAGLLTQLTPTGCGVHPSAAGQAVLALAVAQVTKK